MQILTAPQVAEIFQMSLPRVYEAARLGLLPSFRVGRQLRFDESALRELIARGGTLRPTTDRQTTIGSLDKGANPKRRGQRKGDQNNDSEKQS
jgi:excisionase family DNA binding protein